MKEFEKKKSRRSFLTFMKANAKDSSAESTSKGEEKIKMLTPDGKLVEIDKSAILQGAKKDSSNKEILKWMIDNKNQPT